MFSYSGYDSGSELDSNAPISPIPEGFLDLEDSEFVAESESDSCISDGEDHPVFRGLTAHACDSAVDYGCVQYEPAPKNIVSSFSLYRPAELNQVHFQSRVQQSKKTRLSREMASIHLTLDDNQNATYHMSTLKSIEAISKNAEAKPFSQLAEPQSMPSLSNDFGIVDQMTRSPEFLEACGGMNASSAYERFSRYGLLPYDRNAAGVNGDFVNASFIEGSDGKSKRYIAAEAPTVPLIPSFFRMILRNRVNAVVTLCNDSSSECDRYWPAEINSPVLFGDQDRSQSQVKVTLIERDMSRFVHGIVVRKLRVESMYDQTQTEFTQFHYTKWQDMTMSHDLSTLKVLMEMIDTADTATSPILVHCSAGVGRTGVFIGLHQARETMKQLSLSFSSDANINRNLDDYIGFSIPHLVYNLRRQRCCMVYTNSQFVGLSQMIPQLI